MKEAGKDKIPFNDNIEWVSSFKELGVEVKFLSFWDRSTAFNFKMDPAIFIEVSPVDPDKHKNVGFLTKLVEEISTEITNKILTKEKNKEPQLNLEVGEYKEEDKVLGIIATRQARVPPSLNTLPL